MLAAPEIGEGWQVGQESVLYPGIEDLTNVRNEYQGSIRYAHMDWEKFRARIYAERAKVPGAEVVVSLTCLDQIPDVGYKLYTGSTFSLVRREDLPIALESFLGLPVVVVDGRNS